MPHIQTLPFPDFDPFEETLPPQERHVAPIAPGYQTDLDAQHQRIAEIVRDGEDPGFEQTGVNDRIAREYAEDHPRRNPVAAEAAQAERRAIHQKLRPRKDDTPLPLYYEPFDADKLPTEEDATRAHIGASMAREVLEKAENK